jgi:hypothetical protein
MPNVVLAPDLIQQFTDDDGNLLVGGMLYAYQAGTTTPQPVYTDYTGNQPNTNPIVLNQRGEIANNLGVSCGLWIPPNTAYDFVLTDANNNPIWSEPRAIIVQPVFTQSSLGAILYPIITAESANGITPPNLSYPYSNLLRYGLVPNSTAAATANTAFLQALWNPTQTGVTGYFYFPNTTGSDIYSFNGTIPIRDGIHIDLQECNINLIGAATVNDINTGLFYTLRDFVLENGYINTAFDTTLGVNAGSAITIGARGVGFYYTVYDATQPHVLGNFVLRNLRISTNNTGPNSNSSIQLIGGIAGGLIENCAFNGNNVTPEAIYYEYGWATAPGATAASQSSHMHNVQYNNLRARNYTAYAFDLVGAYNCDLDCIHVTDSAGAVDCRLGEALFFNPWVDVDDVCTKRTISLHNIVAEGCTLTAINLEGAESASGGYLNGAGLTPQQQSDLLTFTIDGFMVGKGTGTGMFVSGPIVAKNGYLGNTGAGAASSGQLIISDDCVSFSFENVWVVDGSALGVRGTFPTSVGWVPPRLKSGSFLRGTVAGNGSQGFDWGNTQVVLLQQVNIGYNALINGQGNEATQGVGVLMSNGADGVICDSCVVTTFGGANAYQITGTTSSGCNIINPQGTITAAGAWDRNGVAFASSSNIASASALINTANKYFLRQCWDTNNNRLMIAQGPLPTDPWIIAGFGTSQATVTPS